MIIKLLFLPFMFLMLMSCSGSIPEPTPGQVEWANHQWDSITIETLRNGRSLYIKKCSGCHGLVAPSKLTSEKWLEVLPVMSKKSKLQPEESELIKRYLLTATEHSDLSSKKSE